MLYKRLFSLDDSNVLVLDVSFRDDLRKFCAWEGGSPAQYDCVPAWARENFSERFEVGTMKLEDSKLDVFIGLKTLWRSRALEAFPDSADQWGSVCYQDFESACLFACSCVLVLFCCDASAIWWTCSWAGDHSYAALPVLTTPRPCP